MTFSYHGANGPEASTALDLYLDKVRQVAAPVGRQTTSVWSSLLECGTGGTKSAIYDCFAIFAFV